MRYSAVVIDFPCEEVSNLVGDEIADIVLGFEDVAENYESEWCMGLIWDNGTGEVVANLVDSAEHRSGVWEVVGGEDIPVPDREEREAGILNYFGHLTEG